MAATAVAAVMVGAIAVAHNDKGFFFRAGGYEYTLVVAVAALALAFGGPDNYSLDHAFGWSLAGEEWGLAAVLGAFALGAAAAQSRNVRLPHWRRGRRAAGDAVPGEGRPRPDPHPSVCSGSEDARLAESGAGSPRCWP